MAYLTPGAMAILQARRQFNTGADASGQFTGPAPVGPPVPQDVPPTPVPPPPPVDRSVERAQRIRQWQMQNPGRAAPRMGRNADGSINWDRSTGIGAAGYAEDQRRAQAASEAASRITTPTNLGPGNLGGGASTNPVPNPYGPNHPRNMGVI